MIYPWGKGIIIAGQVLWNSRTPIKEKRTNGKCAIQTHSKIRHANSEQATLGQLLNLLQTMTIAG